MERKRYIVGVVKIPHRQRDLAHELITEDNYFDMIGGDTPDDDETFPVGSNVTYALDLTEEEVERVRNASNVRYVEEDQILTHDVVNTTYDAIPSESTMKFMEADFLGVENWHGRDVTIAILDGGTSTPVRNYMKWTLVDRKEYQTDAPGSDEVTTDHGCLVAADGVPYGGRVMDLIIADNDGSASNSSSIAAMRYAADNGVRVINYSYSSSGGVDGASQAWIDCFTYLNTKDTMVFATCGNDGGAFINYPAKYSEQFALVHSSINFSTSTGTRSSSSNHLASASGCAPGSNVLGLTPTGDPTVWSGTSASSPHTASLAVRMLTGGRFTPRQVSTALKGNMRDTGQPASEQGGGAYSLLKALTALGAFSGGGGTALTNQSPNPALYSATTGWSASSAGLRIAGLTGFSRPTAFGSSDYVLTPRAATTAGQAFTHSVEVQSDASETLTTAIYWYNSSGALLSTTSLASEAITANVIERITRTATAPASTAFSSLYISKPAGTGPTGTVTNRWVGISDPTQLRIKIRTSGSTSVQVQAATTQDMGGTKWTSTTATPDADGYSSHLISGLTAGTQYFYRALLNGGVAPGVYKAKTAAVGAASFSFAFGSCTNHTDSSAFSAIAARNPDFSCHLGDDFYLDGTSATVANYKAALSAKASAVGQGSVLSNIPTSYTWSDHDFGFAGNAVGTANATTTANANAAYRAVVPTPTLPASGIYYTWTWGRVKFIQLDERTFKSANNAPDTTTEGGGGGAAPVVDAGSDVSVLPNAAFNRTASEIGTGITARQWQITSGPAQVNAVISTAQSVSWTPTVSGTYTVVYTATNSFGPGSDTVAITVTSGGGGGGAVYPMDIMADYWYLTTPEVSPYKDSTWNIYKDSGPVELEGEEPPGPKNPDLDTFIRHDNNGGCNPVGGAAGVPAANFKRQFRLTPAGDAILMTSDYEGSHTTNSTNTRMEFREMSANGLNNAIWSTSSGNHKMMVVTQVDRLDGNHCVIAQIHGASDDVTVFRLEGTTLWRTAGDNAHGATIDSNYALGTPIAIGFHVQGGNCDFYYFKGEAAKTLTWENFFVAANKKNNMAVSDSGCYFKAGNYLQRKGPAGSWTQVTLYKALVSHVSGNSDSSDAVGPPWTKNYQDGTGYPVITGGTASTSVSTASALASASNGQLVTYTGSTITTPITISGKSNITFKNIKLGQGGAVTVSGCSNIVFDSVDAQFDPSGTAPIFFVRGTYDKIKFINCLFGSSSTAAGGGTKSRFIMFGDSGSAGSSYGVVERCTFQNKNNPGNCIHIAGNGESSTGGVRYTLITHCLFKGTKPFDENDHESCLMGLSDFQLTNGQNIIEHCRFEDCWSEPEVISMKMNFSTIRGCVFYECVGSSSLRHGDDGMLHDNWYFGDKDVQGPQTYNRTSAGPRLYGARHKVFNNTIRVNGNGGSRPSATSLFESPLTLDSGDVAPGSTSNGHGNIVNVIVEKNLLVKCGNPIMITKNYSTGPTGTVRDNKIVECANAGSTGYAIKNSANASGLTFTNNQVFATVAAAGLTLGSNPGEYYDPTKVTGARVNYLTASMVGKGSTYDAWSVTHAGSGTAPGGNAPVVNAGSDVSVVTGNPFQRTASETGSGITTREWKIIDGPAQVNTILSTTDTVNWTPTTNGTYTLSYTATSPDGAGADSVIVTASASGGGGGGAETGPIPNKTILGAVQRQWFKDQITNATEPVIVVLGDTVWLGAASSDDDEYFAYDKERQNIAAFLNASGKNVIRLAGDMHSLAVGQGLGYKRVWQAAPFTNTPSTKGSGWTQLYPA